MKTYDVYQAAGPIPCDGQWDSPLWSQPEPLPIDNFLARSSAHHPRTRAKLLYDDRQLHVLFDVEDRYVLCRQTQHQLATNRDSCTEFFFQPTPESGYFNFEVNCGGWVQVFYIEDNTPCNGTFKKHQMLTPEDLAALSIYHSAPAQVEPETEQPMNWRVQLAIPFALIEKYVGKLAGERTGLGWRANFFKCADDSSHPHWASWSPLGDSMSFHLPERFGLIRFRGLRRTG